ncbi:MAG: LytTR family DNA-binding domain-containing protein [Microscillaceae bacterium]|nr:LytTR family DNA-binding domain-containing protein [Microscillaceae bacterium]
MVLKALIIDDSRLARNELRRLLEEHEEIFIHAEASDADSAREIIEEDHPDLIFLDIQMPGKDGFQLIEELEYIPEVIFTTAYNEYAIRAFEVNALDYLVKPIQPQRLSTAIRKVREKIGEKADHQEKNERLKDTDQVFVKDGERCWFVQLADIRLFEVEGNNTKVYFEKESPLITRTLNYLESRLDERRFFRANRQQIINLKWIQRIEPWFSGSLKVYLKGGEEVEISRRQTQKFKDLMSF